MKYTLLALGASLLIVTGCWQASPSTVFPAVIEQDCDPWPLLGSDVVPGDTEPLVVGEPMLRNPSPDEAKVSVLEKSCSCIDIVGVPSTLAGNQSARLILLNRPRGVGQSDAIEVAVQLEWPNRSTQMTVINQKIEVLPDLEMLPSSLSFGADSDQLLRSFTMKLHYRSRRRLAVPKPILAEPLKHVEVKITDEISHQRLTHDIWQVVWTGEVLVHQDLVAGIAVEADPYRVDWMVWRFPTESGIPAVLQVPTSVISAAKSDQRKS